MALRPVGHHEKLSVVDHLDELRTRLVICLIAYAVAFGFCMWQNGVLLDVLNRPLEQTAVAVQGSDTLEGTQSFQRKLRTALNETATALGKLEQTAESKSNRMALTQAVTSLRAATAELPQASSKRQPVTLGVGEPFTTTLTVAAAFALLISLPLILYQIYGFVLPAFSRSERRVALPLLLLVPVLFIGGVVFGYFGVLPPAVKFLQNFNDAAFDILVQARDYYRFELLVLLALGILFQIPVVVLAVTKLGIVTPRQLRHNRRYAVLVIALVAMLLPGTDPISMLLAMLPLILLYEGSILLATWVLRKESQSQEEPEKEKR